MRAWVNGPGAFHGAKEGTPHRESLILGRGEWGEGKKAGKGKSPGGVQKLRKLS